VDAIDCPQNMQFAVNCCPPTFLYDTFLKKPIACLG
jgi:hypothetical protein